MQSVFLLEISQSSLVQVIFPCGLDSIMSVVVVDAATQAEVGVGHARVGDLHSRAEETAVEMAIAPSPSSPESGPLMVSAGRSEK